MLKRLILTRNKILTIALIFSFAFSFNVENAIAKSRRKDKDKKEEVKKAPTDTAVEDERVPLEKIKKSLDNTAWRIELRAIGASPQKETFKDTLRFSHARVASEALAKEGFIPTSYTLSRKTENIFIWETMQTDAEDNLALWKGEIENDLMRGVFSRRKKGMLTGDDYSFMSVAKKVLPADAAVSLEGTVSVEGLIAPAEAKAEKTEKEESEGEKNVQKKFLFW